MIALRLALVAALGLAGAPAVAAPPLAFAIDEGRNLNAFFRVGQVAAHLLLRSGDDPRVLVAFPAGNSGVGLWFARTATPVSWTITKPPAAQIVTDARGRRLFGIVTEAVVDAPALSVDRAVLGSVRVLRDFQALGTVPAGILTAPTIAANRISWSRDRLDGAPGYLLTIEVSGGRIVAGALPRLVSDRRLRLRITAASGEPPLVPLDRASLLNGPASDARAANALEFLSFREKFLAGSWRFDTYFGRDTLMSLRLLMPALQPAAVEDGIASVIARLARNGEVAHEEDIGEFAVLRNAAAGRGRIATPVYDYLMVDDDFMLAPVAATWLLDTPAGRARAKAFLGERGPGGEARGAALARNFAWVVARSAAFARVPAASNLVGLKDGRPTGQWRDSNEGLGRGRYAYDVNVVFVPAALEAIARFAASGLLVPYLTAAQTGALRQAAAQGRAWSAAAPPLFDVTVPAEKARAAVGRYAVAVGVDPRPAEAALGAGPIRFNALALDARGKPVPVLHSDDGFALLFENPSLAALDRSVTAMMRPFPAGLMTDIGLLVANPTFADAATQARFSATAYHGTVVWSWQQAVLAAGLARQLQRGDLPPALRTRLRAAQDRLWTAIANAGAVRTSELWAWTFADGRYRVAPFGAKAADADESNAAQLWSTVFLALKRPPR